MKRYPQPPTVTAFTIPQPTFFYFKEMKWDMALRSFHHGAPPSNSDALELILAEHRDRGVALEKIVFALRQHCASSEPESAASTLRAVTAAIDTMEADMTRQRDEVRIATAQAQEPHHATV